MFEKVTGCKMRFNSRERSARECEREVNVKKTKEITNCGPTPLIYNVSITHWLM